MAERARLQGGVRHHANTDEQVNAVLQRVDKIVGLHQLDIQARITCTQLMQPRRKMALTKNYRRIDAHQSAGFAVLLLQIQRGEIQLCQHLSRMSGEQFAGFCRADGACVAIQQLRL